MRRMLFPCLVAGAVAVLGGASAVAQPPPVQVTGLSVTPLISPSPVEGTDGRVHLAYELLVVNFGGDPATVDSVEALDADDQSRVLDSLAGSDLAAHLKVARIGVPLASAPVVDPGQEVVVWLDASVPDGSAIPRAIVHRVHITYPGPQLGGLIPADVTVTVGDTKVSDIPVPIIAPPLAGDRWLDANGCCSVVTAHRGSVNPLNGTTNIPERTAIDFIRLDDQDKLFEGPATDVSSYAYYGVPITAVADGEVVEARDGLPNQVPTLMPPTGTLPLADFAGNNVIEKFEYQNHTFYALYAHMVPGSVAVHAGDRVHTGQVLGHLGNSGNSGAPHLHFHVMDAPSDLASQGLPYEFDQFRLRGRADGESALDDVIAGKPLTYASGVTPTWFCFKMPLYYDVVDFPERPRSQ